MDKTAQKRSLLNKLHETFSPSGNTASAFFSPEFKKVFEALKLKDDTIRAIVTGEKIGNGEPGSDPISLKQLVKSAKSNFNRREYMQASSDLGRFHYKLWEIANQIGALDNKVNEIHHNFLFKHLTDAKDNETPEQFDQRTQYLQHLKNLHERINKTSSTGPNFLVKEAGIMDFFHNIGTARGRGLALWEKRYPKQTAALKKATETMIGEAEKVFAIILEQLKKMASARATRDVDAYMQLADVIFKKNSSFDVLFRDYYKNHIKGFLDKMFPAGTAQPAEKPVETGAKPPEEPTPSPSPGGGAVAPIPDLAVPAPKPSAPAPAAEPAPVVPDLAVPSKPAPLKPLTPSAPPPGLPLNEVKNPLVVKGPPANDTENPLAATTHRNFYSMLQSLGNESPLILKSYIRKYARSIQHSDPETAVKLLKISQNIQE